MEKHTCKLCFRRFSNGRALGGHMRSHVSSKLPPPPSLSGSFSEEVAEVAERESPPLMEDGSQFVIYGLRENPRKSFRLVDPEFSSTFPPPDSSIVVQDRESETEASKPPALRRRSKRRRRRSLPPEPYFDPEPVSSVSNATPDEDVARCLMMMSRDVWTNDSSPEKKKKKAKNFNQMSEDFSEEELAAMAKSRRGRTKFRCETCKKVFRSYQALGGHRANHKNLRACVPPDEEEEEEEKTMEEQIQEVDSGDRKIHECPVCFRVFGSGQALGGHKRSHISQSPATKKTAAAPPIQKEIFIDLNLPPPEEEGELSAVFDAEQ